MHAVAREARCHPAGRRSRLEAVSAGAAAFWGCALGLDTVLVGVLVYGRTGDLGLAAALSASTLLLSLVAVLVALGAVDRAAGRRPRGPR